MAATALILPFSVSLEMSVPGAVGSIVLSRRTGMLAYLAGWIQVGCKTPYGSEGYAYVRLGAELRYPLMLENSTSIYALGFVEGGNAWTEVGKFNPFSLKRSAGVGVRIFLPMIGMMGIDWAYGFDKINGSSQYGGSQFHFILGQEF